MAEQEFVIVPPSDTDVSQMPLLTDMQFLDPYGSESINRKFFGIIPPGIYRGFKYALPGAMKLQIGLPNEPGTAVVQCNNVCITIQQRLAVDLTVAAGFSGLVVLTGFYQFGVPTKQTHILSTQDSAKIELIRSADLKPNQVILYTVNVPAGTTTLTSAMITTARRQDVSIAVESNIYQLLTDHIGSPTAHTKSQVGLGNVNNWPATAAVNDQSDTKYATAGAVKKAHDLADAALPKSGGVVDGKIVVGSTGFDSYGWPNATDRDQNNYISRSRLMVRAGNNGLSMFGTASENARRFGLQVGHSDGTYASAVGTLELNPYGGAVLINGGRAYHTGYKPTADDVLAMPVKKAHLADWTSAPGMASKTYVGGYQSPDSVPSYLAFGAAGQANLDIFLDGEYYANQGRSRVYHEAFRPTPADIGALPTSGGVITHTLTVNGLFNANGGFHVSGVNVIGTSSTIVRIGDGELERELNLNAKNALAFVQYGSGRHRIYHEGYKPSPGALGTYNQQEIDDKVNDAGFKTVTIAAPAGVEAGKFYPIVVSSSIEGRQELYVSTRSSGGSDPMNNCSFHGIVRAAGWSDKTSYVDGLFTIYTDGNERAIHSIAMPAESEGAYAIYVEARAFPVQLRLPIRCGVACTGQDMQFGSSTFSAGVSSPGGTKVQIKADFSKGSGRYFNSNKAYHEGFRPTADDINALDIRGTNAMSGNLNIHRPSNDAGMMVKSGDGKNAWLKLIEGTSLDGADYGIYMHYNGATDNVGRIGMINNNVWVDSIRLSRDTGAIELEKSVTAKSTITALSSIAVQNAAGVKNHILESADTVATYRFDNAGGWRLWAGGTGGVQDVITASQSGNVNIPNGNLSERGQRVYSPNNKPTPADVGAVNKSGDTMSGRLTIEGRSSAGSFGVKRANAAQFANFGQSGDSGGEVLIGVGPTAEDYVAYLKVGKENKLTYQGGYGEKRIYHEGFKPTAVDVGALPSDGTAVKSNGIRMFYSWAAANSDFNEGANTNQDLRFYWHGSGNVNGPTGESDAKTSGYGLTFGNGNHGGQVDFGYGQWPQFRSLVSGVWSSWKKFYTEENKPTAEDVEAIRGITKSNPLRAGAGWQHLARVKMPQGSCTVKFTLTGGNGFNVGSWAQNDITEIVCRSGNNSPKGITILTHYRGGLISVIENTAWKLVSGDEYDIYVESASYANAGVRVDVAMAGASFVSWGGGAPTSAKPAGLTDGFYNRLYSNNYKPTAADVGALPIGGGKCTGVIGVEAASGESQVNVLKSGRTTSLYDSGVTIGLYSRGGKEGDGYLIHKYLENGNITVGDTKNGLFLQGKNETFNYNSQQVYHTGFRPSPADIKAFNAGGSTGSVLAADGVPWDSDSGVYISRNVVDSDQIVHFKASGNSCPAVQIKARYKNGGLWYRTARDTLGFEEGWAAIYTTKNKPTAADVGAVNSSGDTMTGRLKVVRSGITGWPNNTPNDANCYANTAIVSHVVNNNGLHIFGDGNTNARRMGIQSAHADAGYTTSYGILDLNPFGGAVRVNGHGVYHGGNKPTAADVGALPQTGGTIAGNVRVSHEASSEHSIGTVRAGRQFYMYDNGGAVGLYSSGFTGVAAATLIARHISTGAIQVGDSNSPLELRGTQANYDGVFTGNQIRANHKGGAGWTQKGNASYQVLGDTPFSSGHLSKTVAQNFLIPGHTNQENSLGTFADGNNWTQLCHVLVSTAGTIETTRVWKFRNDAALISPGGWTLNSVGNIEGGCWGTNLVDYLNRTFTKPDHNHYAKNGIWDVIYLDMYAIGSYMMATLKPSAGSNCTPGTTVSGANLHPAGACQYSENRNITLPGTWRCQGSFNATNSDDQWDDRTTLWIRIA